MRCKKLTICAVMVLFAFFCFMAKPVKAADYSSSLELPVDGNWTSDLYLTESNSGESWYKYDVNSDGCLKMKIMMYWNEGGLSWSLYDSDLSNEVKYDNIYGGTETSPVTKEWNIPLSAGTYYLKLAKYNGNGGKYKMCNSFTAYGVNDTWAYSYDSPQLYTIGNTITGGLGNTDIEDWFRFDVANNKTYVLKVSMYWSGGGLSWNIYNSDLTDEVAYNSIYGGTETSPSVETWEIKLDKGTYYLKTSKYNGDGGKYIFSINELTKNNCSHRYYSSYIDSTYFTKGYTLYSCDKCGDKYKDDYKDVLKLSQGYLYSDCKIGKGSLKLYWSTVSDASGYQIRYSMNRAMESGVKIIMVKGQGKSKKRINNLSRKKKYFVQVRAYKKSGARTVYGKWSQKRALKTK